MCIVERVCDCTRACEQGHMCVQRCTCRAVFVMQKYVCRVLYMCVQIIHTRKGPVYT